MPYALQPSQAREHMVRRCSAGVDLKLNSTLLTKSTRAPSQGTAGAQRLQLQMRQVLAEIQIPATKNAPNSHIECYIIQDTHTSGKHPFRPILDAVLTVLLLQINDARGVDELLTCLDHHRTGSATPLTIVCLPPPRRGCYRSGPDCLRVRG